MKLAQLEKRDHVSRETFKGASLTETIPTLTNQHQAAQLQVNSRLSKLRDYYQLTKPEVNLLILMTTSAAYYLGSRGAFHLAGLFNTLAGTLLVASGTATLNQWMERTWDARMRRTASRPLPSGRISSRAALLFGIFLSLAGGLYLALLVNRLSSLLAMATLFSYLLIYTPLKRRTPLCTLLGAFPGAMPVLIGWAGSAAALNRQALFLFAVLFLWQFPHFLAIALMYREDYERAGYRMLPQFDLDSRFTRGEIAAFAVGLVCVTVVSTLGQAGAGYAAAMLLAGVFLLYPALKLTASASRMQAGRLLHASVIYLPVVLLIMVLEKR